jgi:hypothetical protein
LQTNPSCLVCQKKMNKKPKKENQTTNEKPVSLYPLSLEEALEALLKIKLPKEKKKSKKNKDKQDAKK